VRSNLPVNKDARGRPLASVAPSRVPGYVRVRRHSIRRMGRSMFRTITFALIASCLFHSALWARDLRCVGLGDVPNERGIPLTRERIIRVPDPQQLDALRLLGSKTFSPLVQSEVDHLLVPSQSPSSESLLSHQAEDAEDKASQCREMSKSPSFAHTSENLLRSASAYEAYAAYTRALPNKLHAYLVNAKVLFEGTGAYSAFLKEHRLALTHGSLGRGPTEPKNVAVVVFVEAELDEVDVNYWGAE
jgi:hypothetical protein